ncbi:MAG: hypothetical protein ONB46_01685 [candidate division KSB1 bacterium]|nr:hypothetical protein [candidate division KSB1 bacterium]MDZ7364378.1 hypothetical protein [candidate division KSB1 bacterium]MDZ7402750.1 hypothetical protein [candidate division KSB1 bacterium]
MSNSNSLTARAQEMFARIEKYLASGLSQKAFCRQKNLTLSRSANMFPITAHFKFYRYAQATDMRKSFGCSARHGK